MFTRLTQFFKYSIQYACVTHCAFEYLGDFVVCNGPSMEPTLYSKNILLTERITTRFHKPNRGDIIIAISPTNPTQYICKRVVGIPGDKIITPIPNSSEMLSEQLENRSNTSENKHYSMQAQLTEEYIPRGYVWIEGDNSQNSSDSRYYGAIPLGLVKSRVVCRLWPISDIKLL